MPYKHLKYKIKLEHDKRIKLTQDQREDIKRLYGSISQRKLAKAFNVSRRLIIFIGCPEKHKQNLLRRKERGGSKQYYNKDTWAETMKKHRHHKQKLYLEGELIKKSSK